MPSTYTALEPTSQAVFARLNVAAVKAAYPTGGGAIGGVTENPVTSGTTTYPFLWYEVDEDLGDTRHLGAGAGVLRVRLRLHAFSTYPGMRECQRIIAAATDLLMPPAALLTIAGFSHRAIFDYNAVPLPFEELNGVKVRELVKEFELFLDQV
jgi:hypothetical protein